MKSHVNFAVSIYGVLITEISTRWPDLRIDLERDLSRLLSSVESRGLSFLTITLPSFGKEFDRALDLGYCHSWVIPKGIPQKANKPLLFKGLFERIFDVEGMLKEDADIETVCLLRQLLYCCKRLRLECQPQRVKDTLDEFFAIEAHLPASHENTWDCEVPEWKDRTGHPLWGPGSTSQDADLFDLCTHPDIPWNDFRAFCLRIIHGEIGWMPEWDLYPKHGPGATSEATTEVVKYDFQFWPKKLDGRFPFDWFGSGKLDSEYQPIDRELPSRLIAVPKTQKGPRLICAEPVAHQWIQQSIWRWLEGRIDSSTILRNSITFRSQERSRERARLSSIDGKLATIDLSSASDRLSTRLVEYVFQGSNILDGLHACRTRAMSQTISEHHPSMILLRKFAPMGSACTFPIQTIVFLLLTVWALRLQNGEAKSLDRKSLIRSFRQVTVFGDDIIAPTAAVETIKLILHECGLKVNSAKTYGGISFRESCGMDAFKGYDVTPAYILEPYDGSPSSMATTVETSNNFHTRGLWRVADFVVNQLPPQEVKRLYVSTVGEDAILSLRSYNCCGLTRSLSWDKSYQRNYIRVLTVSAKEQRKRGSGYACLTQYFTEDPSADLPWSSGQVGRPILRKSIGRVYV